MLRVEEIAVFVTQVNSATHAHHSSVLDANVLVDQLDHLLLKEWLHLLCFTCKVIFHHMLECGVAGSQAHGMAIVCASYAYR